MLGRNGPLDRLSHGVGRQDAEDHRNVRIHRRLKNAATRLRCNIVEMRRIASDNGPKPNYGIHPSRSSQLARGQRNLERTGNPDHFEILFLRTGVGQRFDRLGQQAARHELVKLTRDNPKPEPGCLMRTFAKLHAAAPLIHPSRCGPVWPSSFSSIACLPRAEGSR